MNFLQPILTPIEQFLFQILVWLEAFVGDWGIAIILLTILVRVLLIPLTWKQTQSMYEMQRVQPMLKEIQEKYKNDKEKQQEELMKFYQEHKVNPFGGCLPMLLQMPVFFALFGILGSHYTEATQQFNLNYVLQSSGQTASFLGLVKISSTPQSVFSQGMSSGGFMAGVLAALPYLILVVLFGLSIWLPQQLMPGEKQQKMIGMYMAIMMLYFGWIAPAGVLLYWVTSSIWGIGQQQLTLKVMGHSSQPAAAGAGKTGTASDSDKKAPAKAQGQSKNKKKK